MIIILTPSIITFIYNIYVKILTLIQTYIQTDIQTDRVTCRDTSYLKIYELEFNNLNSHQNGRGEAEEMAVSCARARQRWPVCQSSGNKARCLV